MIPTLGFRPLFTEDDSNPEFKLHSTLGFVLCQVGRTAVSPIAQESNATQEQSMSGTNKDESSTSGVRQKPPLKDDEDVEFKPGGSAEPNPDPENPGGTAATHHPPAE